MRVGQAVQVVFVLAVDCRHEFIGVNLKVLFEVDWRVCGRTHKNCIPAVPARLVSVVVDGPCAGPQHDSLKRCQGAMEDESNGEQEDATAEFLQHLVVNRLLGRG